MISVHLALIVTFCFKFYRSRGIQLGNHWLTRMQRHYSQRDLGDLIMALDRRTSTLLSSGAKGLLGFSATLLHAYLYRNPGHPR